MFCSNCSKLSYNHTNKTCMRCQGNVTMTIAVICDMCSSSSTQCAACLKKIVDQVALRGKQGACGTCKK